MRVLVADDDLVSRIMVQAEIERLGHECMVAEDGEQAWQRFCEHDPDVVVTDWMMPVVDGLELCRRIRARTDGRYTYIIVATSMMERDNVLTGMEAGADSYLTKPLDPFDLETRLISARRVTSLHAELARVRRELADLARTDPLTKVRNRLSLGDDLAALDVSSHRYGRGYSLAMCDVDSFKAYNDTYGHQAGDEVLRAVASALVTQGRRGDRVYRYGGEEFLIVLPEQTLGSAVTVGERIRRAVEGLGIPHRTGIVAGVVTISVGVAAFDANEAPSGEEVVARADAALYRAKVDGRNRVVPTQLGAPAGTQDQSAAPAT